MANARERRQTTGGIRQSGLPGDLPPVAPAGGGMGYQQPIWPAQQQADRAQSFYEEMILAQYGLDVATLEQNAELADMAAATARAVASTYANAGMAEAAAAAEASVRSSEIAAQAMRDVAGMDNATRMQIANIQAEVERERIAVERRIQESREFGQPINLASYLHYMTQGPGTAVPGTLPQQAAPGAAATAATGTAPLGGMAGLYQAGMPGQAQMGTPAAIVGEPGAAGQAQPELLSMTPQGVQVTPIASQQVKPLQQMLGVPGMQGGGTVYNPSSFGHIPNRLSPVPRATTPFQARTSAPRIGIRGEPRGRAYGPREEPERVGEWFTDVGGWGGVFPGGAGAATPTTPTTPAAATPATPATPTPTTPTTPGGGVDWQAFIDQLYGNVPAYSWTGGLELPEIGVNLPYAPFGQNVTDWQNLPWQVQQGRLSMWRALGIMPETAMGMMYGAAPTGIAQPVARRG